MCAKRSRRPDRGQPIAAAIALREPPTSHPTIDKRGRARSPCRTTVATEVVRRDEAGAGIDEEFVAAPKRSSTFTEMRRVAQPSADPRQGSQRQTWRESGRNDTCHDFIQKRR
jgi:hypothetical protein